MRKKLLMGAAVIMLGITGCAASGGENDMPLRTHAEVSEEADTEATSEAVKESQPVTEIVTEEMNPAKKEFLGILEQIDGVVEVGTAGSSLKSAIGATYLLNWAAGTSLSTDEITELTEGYIEGLEDVKAVTEKMKAVDYTYKELLKPGMEELLSDAGMSEIAAYPWSENGEENINVEAVMKAFGLR